MFKTSVEVDKLCRQIVETFGCGELPSDSCCTAGFDNDGSTGRDIWNNGFSFGREVGLWDRDVYEWHDDVSEGITQFYFFLGSSERDVCNRLRGRLAKLEGDE